MANRLDAVATSPFLTANGVATRLAIRQLKAENIDPQPLLAKAGVLRSKRSDEPENVAADSQLRFLDYAADALDNSILGFQLAQQADLREAGVVYYVMAASRDVAQAVRNLVRYLAVANESLQLLVSESGKITVLTVKTRLPRHIDRHFSEFGIALIVRGFREMTGTSLRPEAVTFAHGRNADIAHIERFLGCPVEFGAAADTVSISTPLLATPIRTSDNYLLAILREHCESILAERGKVSGALRATVENELVRLLPHGKAQVQEVASTLGMSSRTLARRLEQENARFVEIVDELRRDLAMRYLRDRGMSLSQISWLLGYSEVSSLNHACKRWTGKSPKALRGL